MRRFIVLILAVSLASCSGTGTKTLKELEKVTAQLAIKPLWVRNVGKLPATQYRQLPITLVDDIVYVAGSRSGIRAFDFISGKLIWRSDIKEDLLAGPGFGENIVVVATSEAEIIALDASSGKVMWRQNVTSEVLASPLISDGKVFIQAIDGKLSALSIADGSNLWTQSRTVPALTLRGTSRPVIVDDLVVAGFANGQLVAFQKLSGKIQWEITITVPRGRTDLERIVDIDGLFQWQDGIIYAVGYQGRIVALSAQDGQIIWAREISSFSGLFVENNQIYISDAKGQVWALDRKTGATLWRQDGLQGRSIGVPLPMGKSVVVNDFSGYVHWMSKEDGQFVARQKIETFYRDRDFDISEEYLADLDLAVTTSPSINYDRLLVRDNEGILAAFQVLPITQ